MCVELLVSPGARRNVEKQVGPLHPFPATHRHLWDQTAALTESRVAVSRPSPVFNAGSHNKHPLSPAPRSRSRSRRLHRGSPVSLCRFLAPFPAAPGCASLFQPVAAVWVTLLEEKLVEVNRVGRISPDSR